MQPPWPGRAPPEPGLLQALGSGTRALLLRRRKWPEIRSCFPRPVADFHHPSLSPVSYNPEEGNAISCVCSMAIPFNTSPVKPIHPEPKESLPVPLCKDKLVSAEILGGISVRRGCNAKKSFCWHVYPFIPDAESIWRAKYILLRF